MPFIAYNNGIPAANNNPSVDQPDMQTNTDAVDTLLSVDHVSFNSNLGGFHQQVNFNAKNSQGAQTDPQSVVYTASGTASTVSQLTYKNQSGTFPISIIRAFAYVTVGASPGFAVTIQNGFNISSITRTSQGLYTIVLTTNATTGTNFGVIYSFNGASASTSTITGSNTFTIRFSGASGVTDPRDFSFQVLQI